MAQIDLESDLLNYIVRNDLLPGERLPTITTLHDEKYLGISASKIREQLEVARTLGFVEVRSKTGTRVKDYTFTPAVRLSLFYALATDVGNFEMFRDLRKHIEVAYWHEACALLTAEDKAQMRAMIEAARAKLNPPHIRIPNQEHRIFHMTVFEHLENPFVLGLLEAYWDAYDAVELNLYADYSYLQQVWDYHEEILNAIDTEDFEAARQAFIDHTHLLRYQPLMRDIADGSAGS